MRCGLSRVSQVSQVYRYTLSNFVAYLHNWNYDRHAHFNQVAMCLQSVEYLNLYRIDSIICVTLIRHTSYYFRPTLETDT